MTDKKLSETELLSIKRRRYKGDSYANIAERIGITHDEVKRICKQFNFRKA